MTAKKIIIRTKKGFGILEVLLASVIIIIILGALVYLARAALDNAQYLMERSQATFLAQSGMEVVRQIRDSNYVDKRSDTAWNSLVVPPSGGISVAPQVNTPYYIQGQGTNGFDLWSVLFTDPNTGKLNNVITIDSVDFSRFVTFSTGNDANGNNIVGTFDADPSKNANIISNNVIVATVTVTWDHKGNPKEVKIKELLTDVRPKY